MVNYIVLMEAVREELQEIPPKNENITAMKSDKIMHLISCVFHVTT